MVSGSRLHANASDTAVLSRSAEQCRTRHGHPHVLVAMHHPVMLRLTRELLEREFGCWVVTEARTGRALARALERSHPDLMVIDAGDFPSCCLAALDLIPRDRVIVIGPEPDPAYQAAALTNGAGAWLPRDRVAEDLGPAMRDILGCRQESCPTDGTGHDPAATPS